MPALWYHVDGLDHDPATFFHYFSLAVRQHAPPACVPLPRLTAEYTPNLERFALNYFAKAFQCLPKGGWIVFDNIQVVPDDSDLVRILAIALQQLPATMGLAMLSRRDPPVVMARMLTNRTLAHIPKNELGLNREELGQLLSLFKIRSSTDTVEKLYRLTAGWVAGVILWLQRSSGSSELLLIEQIETTGMHYESHQEWQKAIILYRRGLSSAPSAENLLLRLMCCLRTTDRSDEAIQCYLQYRQEIAHSLKTGASSAVQKLYEELSRPC